MDEKPKLKTYGPDQTFESGAKKDTQEGRGDFSLLPFEGLRQPAEHLRLGGIKYGRHNWRSGIPTSRLVSAIRRHAAQLGEDNTENHVAAIIAEAMFLAQTLAEIRDGRKPETLDDLGPLPLTEMPLYGYPYPKPE